MTLSVCSFAFVTVCVISMCFLDLTGHEEPNEEAFHKQLFAASVLGGLQFVACIIRWS